MKDFAALSIQSLKENMEISQDVINWIVIGAIVVAIKGVLFITWLGCKMAGHRSRRLAALQVSPFVLIEIIFVMKY